MLTARFAAGSCPRARHDGIFVKDGRCPNGTRRSTEKDRSAQSATTQPSHARLDSEARLDLRKLLVKGADSRRV